MIEELKEYFNNIKKLRNDIKKEDTKTINKQNLKRRAEQLSKDWFIKYKDRIVSRNVVEEDILKKYDELLQRLLKLSSASSNRKTSYLNILNEIYKSYTNNIILPLSTNPVKNENNKFKELIGDISEIPEYDYLQEAIDCADNHFFRAAAVLGWSATIYRIHKIIEKKGFLKFNRTSNDLKDRTTGRYKRFSKSFNIQSLNEMNTIMDTDILWILEGMNMIDLNEHTRLKSCYDLRCQSAHPSSAPVTEYNLLSFFSDIKEIILQNKKFEL